VAKIDKSLFPSSKSPALFAGLFLLLLLLPGCQTAKTPDEVTVAFWSALIKDDIKTAKNYATTESQPLITTDETQKGAELRVGQIIINSQTATVETTLHSIDKELSFQTELVKQENLWKIDYQKTLVNLSTHPFNGLEKSLVQIGKKLNQQLEKQMPIFEKQIDSLGEQLNRKLDEFGRYLEDPNNPKYQNPNNRGNNI
jgi:hypothetical protein